MVSKKLYRNTLNLEIAQERPCLVNTKKIIHLSVGGYRGSVNLTPSRLHFGE